MRHRSSDGVSHGLPPLPYDFETFSVATFEDPFSSYATRPYDTVAPDGTDHVYHGEEGSSPQELDNKLLGFSSPIHKASIVVDDSVGAQSDPFSEQLPSVDMSAELLGMFFVAEDVFGGEINPSRPLELTCYRRNLWNCSGTITLPRSGVSAILNDNGQRISVSELAASITAVESIESKAAEIISIPWKGTGGGGDEGKVGAAAPPQISLDLGSGQEVDGNRVSVPVSWKRLQFKHATANNGRRKGLQQHYVVQINLLGKTEAGGYIKISEIQSGPVIVRGRSPRNFDSSKRDVPVTAEKTPTLERRLTNEPTTPSMLAVGPMNGIQDLAQNVPRYHAVGNIHATDWMTGQVGLGQVYKTNQLQQQHPAKKLALSPNLARPPVPSWSSDPSQNTVYQQHHQQQPQKHLPAPPSHNMHQRQSLPINLSLSEDERSPNNRSNSTTDPLQSPLLDRKVPTGVLERNPNGSPLEDTEMLYEYFPLSLDDWMPPVDAIYRPHVVHHTVVPPEVKAQQTKSKTKRYFAAD
ncbi:hypothetical protein DL546_009727 [Coniochaeta pulveracea]|uniref:NDT80 domain-containing protein n=1 Tax=Coniochaeta pulveracea TaxID=177199 RepID=A0A420YLI1_9PEZI|nr:hypothetical protein DL546_009727 [Coniochaeta pulveracea]